MADTFDVVIIGGGHAGLATAASVRRLYGEAVKLVVLEGSPRIGNSWHKRYNRLHLHTPKSTSSLPYFPMPKSYPMYVAKEQVRDYLEMYAKELGLPVLLRHHVSAVTYDPADKTYSVDVQVWEGDDGDKGGYAAPTSGTVRSKTLTAKCVVLAMGPESVPFTPDVPGRDAFKGPVLHSTQYKDGAAFKGQNVLVVGFGNSAGEIALCLWEHGARPTMLVRRSTVACMGRDDGLVTALLFNLHIKKHLKPYFRLLDKIMDPVMILKAPNLRPHGVPQVVPAYFGNPGILEGIVQHFEPPAMDVGQFDVIKRGQIKVVRGELRGYSAAGALIAPPAAATSHGNGNGEAWGPTQTLACDAIILCTGYDHTASLRALLPPDLLKAVLPPGFVRPPSGVETASPGLFILGWEDFAGRIALIGQEAQDVAAGIGKRLGVTATSMA